MRAQLIIVAMLLLIALFCTARKNNQRRNRLRAEKDLVPNTNAQRDPRNKRGGDYQKSRNRRKPMPLNVGDREAIRDIKADYRGGQHRQYKNRKNLLPHVAKRELKRGGGYTEHVVGGARTPKGGFRPGQGANGSKRLVVRRNHGGGMQKKYKTTNHYRTFTGYM
ncbi:BAG family molecular chaperone regulator 6 [Acrasis kona]|uniref:BAG family molecular chaperone regulator 6 n=1 Tax=Acrasis kona TaxID=1008807 RepID=A0AAW2ZK65_9EUKA